MRIAAAFLIALAQPVYASHLATQWGCHDDGHGVTVCRDCTPPMRIVGEQCLPPLPTRPTPPTASLLPGEQCRILLRYAPSAPASVTLDEPVQGCDRAGYELALAAILARLLGAPQ
jgi:hypothetical protein